MTAPATLLPGFAEQVHDGQRVFRAAMQAMARPGSVHELTGLPPSPPPLSASAAGLVLALADHESPIWLDPLLARNEAVKNHLRFHTGAAIASKPSEASFALVSRADAMPPLADFPLGSLEYPDRSGTLILQVADLRAGEGWSLKGPGIATVNRLRVDGAPAGFLEMMACNRALFPRGIDVLFAARHSIAALARTTIIET